MSIARRHTWPDGTEEYCEYCPIRGTYRARWTRGDFTVTPPPSEHFETLRDVFNYRPAAQRRLRALEVDSWSLVPKDVDGDVSSDYNLLP